MNLKKEFDAILDKYGHYIILGNKLNKKHNCNAFGSNDDTCPVCFGTGSPLRFTKVLTREQDSNITSSLAGISTYQQFGELAVPGKYFFVKNDIEVNEHDIILDVDWNGDMPVYSHRNLLEVSHIDIKRFENGEVVFKKVYALTEPINSEIRSRNIIAKYNKDYFNL